VNGAGAYLARGDGNCSWLPDANLGDQLTRAIARAPRPGAKRRPCSRGMLIEEIDGTTPSASPSAVSPSKADSSPARWLPANFRV
jgi:hypothetical protein